MLGSPVIVELAIDGKVLVVQTAVNVIAVIFVDLGLQVVFRILVVCHVVQHHEKHLLV